MKITYNSKYESYKFITNGIKPEAFEHNSSLVRLPMLQIVEELVIVGYSGKGLRHEAVIPQFKTRTSEFINGLSK